jgi:protein TonB
MKEETVLRNAIIASVCLHLLLLFVLPAPMLYRPHAKYVEVSLETFARGTLEQPRPRTYPEAYQQTEPLIEDKLRWPRDAQEPIPLEEKEPLVGERGEVPAPEYKPEEIKVTPEITPFVEPVEPRKNEDIFAITGPVSQRQIVRRIYPKYPLWAEISGVEGDVHLKFWVLPGGQVVKVEIEQTCGYTDLDYAAVEALKKWLFEPIAPVEGEENTQWGTIRIRFRLK